MPADSARKAVPPATASALVAYDPGSEMPQEYATLPMVLDSGKKHSLAVTPLLSSHLALSFIVGSFSNSARSFGSMVLFSV